MTWGFVAAAAVSVIGGAINADAQKSAAKKQAAAAQSELELKGLMFDRQMELGEPYRQFGEQYLQSLGGVMQPLDRQAELAAYYKSPEFSMMSDVARNQQLAASEATGGLGSTSTGNALAAIAPQLGQQYLAGQYANQADLYNRLMGGVNIGLSGAGIQQNAMGQYGTQAGNVMARSGAEQAAARLAQGQTYANMVSNIGGAFIGGFGGMGGMGGMGGGFGFGG